MTSPDSQAPFHIALGVCGGIAAYKAVEVLRGLQRAGCVVRVAMTKRACEFVQPLTFRALSGSHVVVDDYAPDNPDPIAHITFSQTTHLLIVAPATANIIGKFANGIADDFLTSLYLATRAPVLMAPAMNTNMLEHDAVRRNLQILGARGVRFVEPGAGYLACGWIGKGRLAEPEAIAEAAERVLAPAGSLLGRLVIVTARLTMYSDRPARSAQRRSGQTASQYAKATLRKCTSW